MVSQVTSKLCEKLPRFNVDFPELCLFVSDMKQTRLEYEEWTPVESHVEEAFGKALRKLKELKPYETALVSTSLFFG